MKKIVLMFLFLVVAASAALAMPSTYLPYGVGAKYAAMGGAGSALVDDMAAAYYNPAGMARAQAMAIKVGAGYASDGSDKLINMLSGISNPAKFMADNFSTAIDMHGNANAIVGLDLFKIGITTMPVSTLSLVKPAGAFGSTLQGNVVSDSALTMGWGVGLPFIGQANVGANIKYVYNANAGVTATAAVLTTDLTNTVTTYSGMSYDLGMQTEITAIPTLPISFALVYKDLGATLSGHQKVDKATYNNTDGSKVAGSDTNISDADIAGYSVPSTLVLGLATEIPVVGATVAYDLDTVSGSVAGTSVSCSVNHLGAQYPVLGGLINLRAGLVSGGLAAAPISMTTYGAGVFGDMVNIAMVTDNNNSQNNQTIADVHLGF